MYGVVREELAVQSALASAMTNERSRYRAPRVSTNTSTPNATARPSAGRRILRMGARVFRPLLRPFVARYRVLLTALLREESAALASQLSRENAMLAAHAQRTEALIVTLIDSVAALQRDVEELRRNAEHDLSAAQRGDRDSGAS